MGAPGAPEGRSARKFRESGCFRRAAACTLRNPPLPAEARPMRAGSGALSKGAMDNMEDKINAAPLSAQKDSRSAAESPAPCRDVSPGRPAQGSSTPPPVTGEARWLLLGALLIGVACAALLFSDACGSWGFALFWCIALLVYLAYQWRRVWENRYAMLLLLGTLVLNCRYFFDGGGEFGLINYLLVPCLFLLFLVFVQENPARQREGVLLPAFFAGFGIKPFSAIGRAFAAMSSLGRGRKQLAPVLIGLLVGLPLAAIVTALLTLADAGMAALVGRIFCGLSLTAALRNVVVTFVTALLFYSLFYNAFWGQKRRVPDHAAGNWPPVTLGIVTALLLLVYAVFAIVQFQYLFGGKLPGALTYSEYAREGFWQLIAVALMNFTLFGLTCRYAKKTAAGLALQALLLFATALLLASAAARLLLYIGAYGLTMMRILPLWLMVYLAALTLLCGLRLWRERLPLLRIAAATLLYWYVALNLPDWSAVIELYNAAH